MDYYWLVASLLIYVLVLVMWPSARRAWLIIGGTLAGAFIVFLASVSVVTFFVPGLSAFGLLIWILPVFVSAGGVAGLLLVLWWTRPAESPANHLRDDT
jgi:hypothetical protein